MLTLIEPESGLMECIGPKLKQAEQDYIVLGLNDFCQMRSIEFGRQGNASNDSKQPNKYWLGTDLNSVSKNLLQTFCDVEESSIWINDPIRAWQTHFYGYQLRLAELSGFQIPRTVMTHIDADITYFKNQLNQDVVKLNAPVSEHEMHIYREAIIGGDYIRVYTFGQQSYAINLGALSETIDESRAGLSQVEHFVHLDADTTKSLNRFMRMCRLDFGIFDLCKREDAGMLWLNFSTDVKTLTSDDVQLQFAGLCGSLAQLLSGAAN